MRMGSATSRSIATACVSPRASCGGRRRPTAIRCASTCSTTTWISPERAPPHESQSRLATARQCIAGQCRRGSDLQRAVGGESLCDHRQAGAVRGCPQVGMGRMLLARGRRGDRDRGGRRSAQDLLRAVAERRRDAADRQGRNIARAAHRQALRHRVGRHYACAEMNSLAPTAATLGAASKVPVTILTGFLGAGKTTLLNRILRERHGERIAVIENEFGEAGVDNDLLFESGGGQIVEMNNGCICCTVRGDLVRILGELRQRREARSDSFDRVIIETTGLADPAPVAQTFFIDEDIAAYYALDAIVTVVDAKHAARQLDAYHEAQEQAGFADRILLSKSDLVSDGEREELRERLVRINPRAPVKPVHFGETPIADLLDIKGFSLEGILEMEPGFLGEEEHEHDDAVQSFVFTSSDPFDQARLQEFFRNTIAAHAKDLMRYKGIVAFAGLDHRIVFQGVHMMMASDIGRPWSEGERRESKLVFIGRNLPKGALID